MYIPLPLMVTVYGRRFQTAGLIPHNLPHEYCKRHAMWLIRAERRERHAVARPAADPGDGGRAQKWCRIGRRALFGCVPRRNEACLSASGRRRCMAAAPLCMACFEKGVLTRYTGDMLALQPLLIVEAARIEAICGTVAEVLTEVE
ncbi:hypothetical protein A6V36_31080 [Paraburkholderia ginsengiterrae]|uniref:Uncharacterized protein n=2 Tax=Paraburkholderia ginsengiterrae TaxID=1462993 RepID=A0A1A9MWJ7_9BURK|nr:hypothetical protein A6V37_12175 [Paraburkholderia ginsengiterrae]OAJ57679.1 hypothetical protein A6V36_31080 [Paraburkholderia ginsengiterrae]